MIKTCLNCGQETKNPKFCSKSCAATYNNKYIHKRKSKEKFCKHCGISLGFTTKSKVCDSCNVQIVDWEHITKRDIVNKRNYQIHSRIREKARYDFLKSGREAKCAICGYDKHINICHIKPISDFPDDATIMEINSIENIIILCPNHHWELDHGLLDIKDFALSIELRGL